MYCHGPVTNLAFPLNPTLAAEILEACEAVQEIVLLEEVYTVLLGSKKIVKNMVLVYSKDWFHELH